MEKYKKPRHKKVEQMSVPYKFKKSIKLTEWDKQEIRRLHKIGWTYDQLKDYYKVCFSTIYYTCNPESWKRSKKITSKYIREHPTSKEKLRERRSRLFKHKNELRKQGIIKPTRID